MSDPIKISEYIVEYFLLGKTHSDVIERYTQDAGVVADVWLRFAEDATKPVRVLISPADGIAAVDMAWELHHCLKAYRASRNNKPFERIDKLETAAIAPLDNFAVATIYFDELLRVVMPLTRWWRAKKLGRMRSNPAESVPLVDRFKAEILMRLGKSPNAGHLQSKIANPDAELSRDALRDFRIIDAAPIAAAIGVFRAAFDDPRFESADVEQYHGREGHANFIIWVEQNAQTIAKEAHREFQEPLCEAVDQFATPDEEGNYKKEPVIQRVFLDRQAGLSGYHNDALSAIKADAASRLFEIQCDKISWGVIDSGIAATHPAFRDWSKEDAQPFQSRIKSIYDFTLIHRIRNFDLIDAPKGSERRAVIKQVISDLGKLPGCPTGTPWRKQAAINLEQIASQLEQRLLPDWGLIEPVIKMEADDGAALPSDHGTHVAGTLGADWREDGKQLLAGACPDINIYDLRVIPSAGIVGIVDNALQATEFALVAATEFVQFLNRKAGPSGPIIHGINISMSIPHDVRNYGCGATPVCVACDQLAASGVVVVAAAGNRGWNQMETGFGNFTFCSITDPGNGYNVITVGSTHRSRPHTYGVSYFSSRGPTGDGRIKPDLVAPGEKIRGPIRSNAQQELDGTSMAAPYVSGAAAMLMARNRELIGKPMRVKQILCESATDLGRERYFQGHGLVDVLRALQSI